LVPASQSKALITRFSTADVPERDRTAILHDVLGRIYLRTEIEPQHVSGYRASVEHHSWSSVSLLFSETDAARVMRTPALLADGDDHFRLSIPETAPAHFCAEGLAEDVAAGDAMLLFNGVACTVRYDAGRTTGIKIGYKRLVTAAPRLEGRAFRRIPSHVPAMRLLLSYAAVLRDQGPSDNRGLSHHVAQHITDLVALAVSQAEERREQIAGEAVRAARLATIRADVLTNLGHKRLSAKTVAQRHALSDRYVHVLFEQTGQTFSRFVEEERLKRAFALLIDPKLGTLPINDIAAQVGYVEHSTFTRAFRRRFGDSPRGVRNAARD
jgi:AraC-like DNA-binding protein